MTTRAKVGRRWWAWAGIACVATGIVATAAGLRAQEAPGGQGQGQGQARAPRPVAIPGVENAFRLSTRLYSGGQPTGAASFEALRRLGVRTIISVDGATPDVEGARRAGLRYVHLPVGYDGIPREQAARLVKAIGTLDGPVFVHCHHGKHRGPAAAALCGLAAEGWSKEQALSWMKDAGTSPDYRGLFASVRGFTPPTAEELRAVGDDLPERVAVPALIEAMVHVDEHWDRLKAIREAGFRAPAGSPDLDPPHEALQLSERFREILRLEETRRKGEDFREAMAASLRASEALREALRAHRERPTPDAKARAEAAFQAAGASCTSCHARHRDRSSPDDPR